MVQILIRPNDKFSISEMAQMAIEAGAAWIVLSVGNGDELRDEIRDITDMCRASGIILTCDNVELVREYGMHGVLTDGSKCSPAALREELGAEAIIGAVATTPDAALTLERADIDYVALTKSNPALIMAVRDAGGQIPVVAYMPDFEPSPESIAMIKADGFSGLCAGPRFFEKEDPVAAISEAIAILTSL